MEATENHDRGLGAGFDPKAMAEAIARHHAGRRTRYVLCDSLGRELCDVEEGAVPSLAAAIAEHGGGMAYIRKVDIPLLGPPAG